MKFFKTKIQFLQLACSFAYSAQLLAASTPPVDELMAKVDHAQRKPFSTQLATVKITTCKYTLNNGKVSCTEKPRIVVAESVKMSDGADGLYNAKTSMLVREPISDKGTSMLIYEYGERGRDNDNWLYLPALGKINRIIANDDDGGSVFGSEFSVETAENPMGRKIYEFTYKIIEESTYQGRPVWVVEMLPTLEKAKKTNYNKVVAWIDKATYLVLKEDLYRNGKVYKQRVQTGIERIDDVTVVTKMVMNNLATSRISQMEYMGLRHNIDVPDEYLSQRAMTDFAYRERYLSQFRSQISNSATDAE